MEAKLRCKRFSHKSFKNSEVFCSCSSNLPKKHPENLAPIVLARACYTFTSASHIFIIYTSLKRHIFQAPAWCLNQGNLAEAGHQKSSLACTDLRTRTAVSHVMVHECHRWFIQITLIQKKDINNNKNIWYIYIYEYIHRISTDILPHCTQGQIAQKWHVFVLWSSKHWGD